jgi:CopG family transcriptional regulator/antitoxin EndoAI
MGAALRQRINVTLPVPTVRLLDRVAGKGERSRLIDYAVRSIIDRQGRRNLRKLLREGATQRAQRDRVLAEDWFRLDDGV